MKHLPFGTNMDDVEVAICIKTKGLNKQKMLRHYIQAMPKLKAEQFIGFDLWYNAKDKAPAKDAKIYAAELLHEVRELGIGIMLVCDATYFKFLTSAKSAEPHYGYIRDCTVKGFEDMKVILCVNHQALSYNPNLQERLDRSLAVVETALGGTYQEPGQDILHSAHYPSDVQGIQETLDALHRFPELFVDIEAKSLEFWNAGVSTIAFSWDKHNGTAFGVERSMKDTVCPTTGNNIPIWRHPVDSRKIKNMIREFIETYEGKLTYHNIGYDGKVLVYELWMDNLQDYTGMIAGIKQVTKNFDDTKIIAYMATNNAVKNELGLKPLSAEYTGDYAQEDIKDTTKIPIDKLLEYNLIDCLATAYVKEKYEPVMIKDEQQDIYEGLMKDSLRTLMQTELCGMPINPVKVRIAKKQLTKIVDECNAFFSGSSFIKRFHMGMLLDKAEDKTEAAAKAAKTDRATKVYTFRDSVIYYDFNPSSNTQLQELLYGYLGYPVLDLTKSKQPSTAGKTIKKLKALATDPEHIQMFEYLGKLADASIILSTFIPAFENAQQLPDGSWRLYGNFNAAGTQSLRLSSSNPNLMNLPSGSTFAKIVKECFEAITGWLFCGSDFDALEDKTGALLTRDPQRLKIYTDGYCGHCLRAQSYWPDKMPDIDPASVDSINSIKKKYKKERQTSKAPSFALQYNGTWKTLMTNCGFSEAEAKAIEARYHQLYMVSDAWMLDVIENAKKDGYVTMAFGARIRTPLLAMTIGTGRAVPYAAMAEARSAGNAATQSYCVLTLRAFNEFMKRVWDSPYAHLILPAATIHDAIYLMIQDSAAIVKWVNDNLIECMSWQELPEIQHPTIGITSSLEIFWPNWSNAIELKNGADTKEIRETCVEGIAEYKLAA